MKLDIQLALYSSSHVCEMCVDAARQLERLVCAEADAFCASSHLIRRLQPRANRSCDVTRHVQPARAHRLETFADAPTRQL